MFRGIFWGGYPGGAQKFEKQKFVFNVWPLKVCMSHDLLGPLRQVVWASHDVRWAGCQVGGPLPT